ncbi:MAG: hypothetical protein HY921_13290 [Elusimicrobia bacterium]|nr:hypothetical protein [Elusimicrobiota bacterium]
MICSLMLDLDDSSDFPGNTGTALGRPLAAYPFMAARSCAQIHRNFVLTDSPPVKAVALQYGGIIIDPPPGRSLHEIPAEEQLWHGLQALQADLKREDEALELLLLFFSNAPALTGKILEQGLDVLHDRPELDSAASVSPRNRFNPFLARKENSEGLLDPFIPEGLVPSGDIYYPDWGAQILRSRNLEQLGPPPYTRTWPWLGKRVFPLKRWSPGPIDFQWQVPALELWLQKNGVANVSSAREPQLKPQPAPKTRP